MNLSSDAPRALSHLATAPAPAATLGSGDRGLRVDALLVTLVASLAEAFELDRRERSIARMVLRGHDAKTIAMRLELTHKRATWMVQDVYAKTGSECRRSLMRVGLRTASARERVDAPVRVMPRWGHINGRCPRLEA